MPKMIQIRNVPDRVHRRLKSLAAAEGLSLSDYLNEEIRTVAERPSLRELQERIRKNGSVKLPISAADIIREERDAR